MESSLNGKVALVTGGNSGIGRAVATELAGRGAHVILSGRNQDRGALAVADIRANGGRADFVPATLDDEASARKLAKEAVALGGGHVDILVNNAGMFPFGPTHKTTEEQFDAIYGLNVKVPYFLVAELAPPMVQRGHGAIVNIGTMVAHFGMAGMALYGSTKAALVLLTKAWAAEFGPAGVRVNAVSPGPTRTEGAEVMGEGLDQLAQTLPLRRTGQPEEIAAAVAFLVSDDAAYVQGAVLPVDGGRVAV
ncbi:SDR family oxidoreductase [Sinomonas sp. JGH33]|uniref:SDR family oxidoreductase n=1 Tax=Sinomonas terricola TaxID=3110330 RepID=A0ABU5T227_9MICC|nr:SDR family oxidoreductase [Sinomonas sp. JGH33]MEA5453718.1 SDR family oxidoreductase [Sinomonas sp. JGH33]